MAPCGYTAAARIEKIRKNQIDDADRKGDVLPVEEMLPVVVPGSGTDIAAREDRTGNSGRHNGLTPELIPDAPSFQIPANPLLPPGYQEVLDYNAVQYVNGFYRTQIGRYVRVEQVMGTNDIETKEGFLIGVGINYLILQEAAAANILIVDLYSVKNMYVYYQNDPNDNRNNNRSSNSISNSNSNGPDSGGITSGE